MEHIIFSYRGHAHVFSLIKIYDGAHNIIFEILTYSVLMGVIGKKDSFNHESLPLMRLQCAQFI